MRERTLRCVCSKRERDRIATLIVVAGALSYVSILFLVSFRINSISAPRIGLLAALALFHAVRTYSLNTQSPVKSPDATRRMLGNGRSSRDLKSGQRRG